MYPQSPYHEHQRQLDQQRRFVRIIFIVVAVGFAVVMLCVAGIFALTFLIEPNTTGPYQR